MTLDLKTILHYAAIGGCEIINHDFSYHITGLDSLGEEIFTIFHEKGHFNIQVPDKIRFRKLSSMTEEEAKEFVLKTSGYFDGGTLDDIQINSLNEEEIEYSYYVQIDDLPVQEFHKEISFLEMEPIQVVWLQKKGFWLYGYPPPYVELI